MLYPGGTDPKPNDGLLNKDDKQVSHGRVPSIWTNICPYFELIIQKVSLKYSNKEGMNLSMGAAGEFFVENIRKVKNSA